MKHGTENANSLGSLKCSCLFVLPSVCLYNDSTYACTIFHGYSLLARIFEMNPFEPWMTRDKVDRVGLRQH